MRKSISLLGLGLLVLFLESTMQVGAISASQVGAKKVVYSYSCHWAGVMYSVEYTCLICG
ncbi:hypothetical protein DDW13_05595 [Acidianus hospitalis]|uniref:Uncharacterized protein n=1 Tax=Acidianus hospitalis TaxID=563177 RepID=A0A2T9X4N4_9CREN|nr:hypothetical protein DDW13_05595 [Acidianus hospitalis]